jgi:hypothetical protein
MPRYQSTLEDEILAQMEQELTKTAQVKKLHKPNHPKAPTPEEAKKTLEKNPRTSWQDANTLLNLYGLKPQTDKSMEYERNIAEVAHPGLCILAPSYDKINGLIENVNQRQDILLHIVNKTPQGSYVHRRYAQSNLMQSLVKTANHLDNKEMTQLRKLADTCIEQLYAEAFGWEDVKNFFEGGAKTAEDVGGGALTGSIVGGTIGGVLGAFTGTPFGVGAGIWGGAKIGGAAGGLLAALFKTAPQAKNVAINAQEAHEALQALTEDHANDILLNNLLTATAHISQTADLYARTLDQAAETKGNHSQGETVATAYLDELSRLDQLIEVFTDQADQGRYAPQESDWFSKIKAPITGIFGSDVHKAVGAVRSLDIVVKNAMQGIQHVAHQASQAASQAPSQAPAAKPAMVPAKPAVSEQGWDETGLEEAIKELQTAGE